MKMFSFAMIFLLCIDLYAKSEKMHVIVKLDEAAENEVAKISKSLEDRGIDSLYKKGYIVHLTLYGTTFSDGKISKIKKVIDDIAANTNTFPLEFISISRTAGNWLMLNAAKSDKIQALADEVTARLISLRRKNISLPSWAKGIKSKERAFSLYGSPNVFAAFEPHITLLTPEDENILKNFTAEYPAPTFTSNITAIALVSVDDFGQAKEILYLKEIKK